MHDDIVRFSREGLTGENHVQTKEWWVRDVENEMRDNGYVPSIDNDPQYTVDYLGDKEGFKFVLSVYGVYVGEDKAWQVSGVTSGKTIMRSTQKTK
jgi:hypothetical protein